jgi:hypothetical protein
LTRAREMDAKMVKAEQRKERKMAEKLSAQVAALQAEVVEKEKETRASKLELKVRTVLESLCPHRFAPFSPPRAPPSLARRHRDDAQTSQKYAHVLSPPSLWLYTT